MCGNSEDLIAQTEDFAVQCRQVPVSLLYHLCLGHTESKFSQKGAPLGWLLLPLHRGLGGTDRGFPHCTSTHMAGKGELMGQVCTSPQASLHAGS